MITTRYVASRLLTTVLEIPRSDGTWPTAIFKADPVMNAEIAANEMTSTIQPKRIKPIKQTIAPATMARAEAMALGATPGRAAADVATTLPVTVDRTATG